MKCLSNKQDKRNYSKTFQYKQEHFIIKEIYI